MAHWLVKSEPFKYSWDKFVADGRTHWDGVRNHQAAINLKAMAVGDKAFFYHSVDEKRIVGVVEVVKEAYPDATDPTGRFVTVDQFIDNTKGRPSSFFGDGLVAHVSMADPVCPRLSEMAAQYGDGHPASAGRQYRGVSIQSTQTGLA